MPVVRISMRDEKGRTTEKKAELARRIMRAMHDVITDLGSPDGKEPLSHMAVIYEMETPCNIVLERFSEPWKWEVEESGDDN